MNTPDLVRLVMAFDRAKTEQRRAIASGDLERVNRAGTAMEGAAGRMIAKAKALYERDKPKPKGDSLFTRITEAARR